MTLFINACLGNGSRTEQIARAYLKKCTDVAELRLDDMYLEPLDAGTLQNRNYYISQENFTHSYFDNARQFAAADEIVIAAPYWDLTFPSKLRAYLESVCIEGLTFCYSQQRIPVGLCKANRLTYITTSGGRYRPDFSYDYIRSLAGEFFGISETHLIFAENLDAVGYNPKAIVAACIRQYC